jgi:hypothetical protein
MIFQGTKPYTARAVACYTSDTYTSRYAKEERALGTRKPKKYTEPNWAYKKKENQTGKAGSAK